MAERWNPDEDILLRRLYEAGNSRSEIAMQLSRSEYAIDARRRTSPVAPVKSLQIGIFDHWAECERPPISFHPALIPHRK
jgi:hypothetical protein